ncbi:MAG: hypothetical protein WCD76_01215 [Pyrinomonadaceae bacterium]
MKPLIVLCLLFCVCSLPGFGGAADDLELRVELTTGERSKDSSSQTTTISIAPQVNAIILERSFSGFHGRSGSGDASSRREYKLSSADRRKLIELLESKNLLVTDSIELPEDPATHQYFDISIESALGGKKGVLNLRGPRTAVQVKEKRLYQDSIVLVREIYRIINDQDKSIVFQELVAAKSNKI